ncbi:MAG: hypothetical protein M3277_07705, partial [Actinomycetota bacterium]|nr:hypothetical protein [Actinomycetota bacterium]
NGIACFQKNGMVTIAANGLQFVDAAFFERYPTYMEFDGIDNDAIAGMYADNMKKMGFFDKGYKLGIITWAEPGYANPTKDVLVPRLQQLGVEIADVTYITPNQSGGEAATPIAQIGNTALRYKNDNITHVMLMDSHGSLMFFFGQAAERQQYRPRYGLHSGSGGTALANAFSGTTGEQDARNQFEDAVMIGWWPTIDVRFEDIPSWGKSPRKKVCHKIMRQAGIEMPDANAEGLAENVCNNVWAIQATLDAIPGNVINQQTWYQSLARVSQMNLVLTNSPDPIRLSPSRRDPLENYARAKFYDDCICFKYVSGRLPIPD